jgi:N-acyl homoserine lactone hydrolase
VQGPERLGILDYGTFEVAEDGRRIPILGFVIVAGDRVVLVDTGFPAEYVSAPAEAATRDGLDTFGRIVTLTERHRPAGQLELAGLTTADVTDLVITHGDIDHVGGLHDFPSATLVVSRAEREAGPPRYFGDRRPLDWPLQRTRLVDTDVEELLSGVLLLSTPGHTPGHLSLLVRLPRTGSVLIAGDAISRPDELETGVNGGAWDQEVARRSAVRLVEVARREDALVVLGHDPGPAPPLRRVPDWYR